MSIWQRLFGGSETKPPKVAQASLTTSAAWLQACVAAPKGDHWTEIPIREFDRFTQAALAALEQGFKVPTKETLELFRLMVAAQCARCRGVISGDQMLTVGAFQQAMAVVGPSDFWQKLADGKCPACAHDMRIT